MSKGTLTELSLDLVMNTAKLESGVAKTNSTLNTFESKAKNIGSKVSSALSFAGIGIGIAGVFAALKAGYTSTERGSDNFKKLMDGGKTALNQLLISAGKADFSHLASEFKRGYEEGKRLADVFDELGEMTAWTNVAESKIERKSSKAWEEASSTKDPTKRNEAKAEYLQYERELLDIRKTLAKETYDVEKDKWGSINNLNESEVNYAISVYQMYNDMLLNNKNELNKYKRFVKELTVDPAIAGQVVGQARVGKDYNINIAQAVWDYTNKFQNFAEGAPEKLAEIVSVYFNSITNANDKLNGALKRTKELIEDIAPDKVSSDPLSTVPTGHLSIPTLATQYDTTQLIEPAESFKNSWNDSLISVNVNAQDLLSSFESMSDTVNRIAEDGKVSFTEWLSVISEVANVIGQISSASNTGTGQTASEGGFWGGISSFMSIIGSIGSYAEGTTSAPGGLALVGERGPELVNLPRGSQVYTHSDTLQIMGGNSQEIRLRLAGTDLVGAFNMQSRSNNSYR